MGEVVPVPSLKLDSVLKTSVKSKFQAIALAGFLTLALASCASLPADAPIEKVDYRACLITQDDIFGKATGLNELSEYGVKQAVVTYGVGFEKVSSTKEKFASGVKSLAKKGCNAIVAAGSDFGSQVAAIAVANPSINFLYVGADQDMAVIDGSVENLAVYRVDLFEAGMVQGYTAASLSKLHSIALYLQPQVNDGGIQAGIREGVAIYDGENDTQTSVYIAGVLMADYSKPGASDIALIPANVDLKIAIPELNNSKVTIVALGNDLYEREGTKDLRDQIFATVRPEVATRIMEMIAADLEGEFIGGSLGSTVATFGNGGIKLSPEHEQNYANGLVDALQKFTLDYETKTR